MYAAVGIHPHHASDASDADLALLAKQAREDKVVAIGETGLDFHYNFSTKDRQVEVFRAELTLAADRGMPVVVHSRDAFAETLAILDEFAAPPARRLPLPRRPRRSDPGPPRPRLVRLLHRYRHLQKRRRRPTVGVDEPLDRMMLETDCPFISPDPVRHIRPCEPAMLVHTARKIAELKALDPAAFADAVNHTSRSFFALP